MSTASSPFLFVWSGIVGFILIFLLRLSVCLPAFRGRNQKRRGGKEKSKAMVIWGSGGHTTEMILLLKSLRGQAMSPLHYVIAETDKTSREKIENAKLDVTGSAIWKTIPRSREVKQNWITTVFTTAVSLLHSLALIATSRPELIICNGPGTCVPLCYAAFLFNVLGLSDSRIIFVESFCRVEKLSLTGKLLYPIADRFIVQWQRLLSNYPRAEFLGDGRNN